MLLPAIILIPFGLALLTAALPMSVAVRRLSLTASVSALFVLLLSQLPEIEQPHTASWTWVPELDLHLSFYLDGLALVFALVITGVGAAVMWYTGYYFEDEAEQRRAYALLLAFMGSMLGLVMSGNILLLFICWELTSIISFMLISFYGGYPEARFGAMQALIITGGGGLALLAGLVIMGMAAGTTDLPALLSHTTLNQHDWYTGFTGLILLGAFTKSAQFPFHFWLPGGMTAPSPASAYLHSATMVKAGIYLLLRFAPVLGGTDFWLDALTIVGGLTLLIGAFLALFQWDLKGMLAYSTISQLGALVLLIGLPGGTKAALIGVIGHALYKSTLFLLAGAIDHTAGTRDLKRLGGLRQEMPFAAGVAVLAGLSMAGVPPLLGFVAKETLLDALLHDHMGLLYLAGATISAALTVTVALMLVWDVFFRPKPVLKKHKANEDHLHQDEPHHAHHTPDAMLAGAAVLAGLSLLLPLLLHQTIIPLIDPAVSKDFELHLFPGLTTAFGLSMVALVSGGLLFTVRQSWRIEYLPLPRGTDIYGQLMGLVERAGDLVLRVQNGKIRTYLVVILSAMALLALTPGLPYINVNEIEFHLNTSQDILGAVLLILSLVATLATILFRKHLLAALALGVAGYAIGGVFLLVPAPDVALVQFLVETLGTVLIIIMLSRIGEKQRQQAIDKVWHQARVGLVRDIIISTVVGVVVGAFALAAVVNRPDRESISEWHLANSYEAIGATDVVAAIVTDFRGTDTLIEITVFSMAGLGVLTITTIARSQMRGAGKLFLPSISTPLTRFTAILMLPFAFLIALSQLLYASTAPGDGFTAGVIGGIAVAILFVTFGYEEAKRKLVWLHPIKLIGLGLALAYGNALVPLLFNEDFLRTTSLDYELPAGLHLASTTLFETGIFLSVMGGISLVMESIAHPEGVEVE